MIDIHHVIKHAKFGDDHLRGSGVVAGQISAFPIDFAGGPYNTLTLPCERVITTRNTRPEKNMIESTGALCHTSQTDARVVAAASRAPQCLRRMIDQGGREQTSVCTRSTATSRSLNTFVTAVSVLCSRRYADCQPGRRLLPSRCA